MKKIILPLLTTLCVFSAGIFLSGTGIKDNTNVDTKAFKDLDLGDKHINDETPFLFLSKFQDNFPSDSVDLDIVKTKRVLLDQGNLLTLQFELTNNQTQPLYIKPSQFTLQVYGEEDKFPLYHAESSNKRVVVPAMKSITGTLTYTVKKSNGYLLLYQPDKKKQISYLLYESVLCH